VNISLTVLGIVFLGAAAVGGGLKAAGVSIPVLASGLQQLLLAVVGAVALAVAFFAPRLGGGGATSDGRIAQTKSPPPAEASASATVTSSVTSNTTSPTPPSR